MIKEKNIFEIQLKAGRRELFNNVSGSEIERDDYVIVEAEKGEDIGFVYQKGNLTAFKCGKKKLDPEALKKILRPATENDVKVLETQAQKEKEAFKICRQKIEQHKLPMKLVNTEIQFDHSKITFYFTAEQRVDFRELVKDLASIYRTRIELRQIGTRDEARRLGGFGICGLKQCCTTFINEFEQITTHMARDQQLSLNPSKISGNCGRLLCCLRYELDFYQEKTKECPLQGDRVKTPKAEGIVAQSNIFSGKTWVKYDSGEMEELPCSACKILQSEKNQNVKSNDPPPVEEKNPPKG